MSERGGREEGGGGREGGRGGVLHCEGREVWGEGSSSVSSHSRVQVSRKNSQDKVQDRGTPIVEKMNPDLSDSISK